MFKDPLSRKEIEGLLKLIPMDQLFSRKSRRVKALGLDVDALNDVEKLDLMTREPALLRRPIVIAGRSSVEGFDTEKLAGLRSRIGPGIEEAADAEFVGDERGDTGAFHSFQKAQLESGSSHRRTRVARTDDRVGVAWT